MSLKSIALNLQKSGIIMSILIKTMIQLTSVCTHSIIYLNKCYMLTQKWDPSMPPTPPSDMGVGLSQILTSEAHTMIFHHQTG